MSIEEIISQLESLKDNSASFITKDSDPIWEQDVKALNETINILKFWRVEMDEMMQIVICKYCNSPEYYGKMRWLSGKCCCRNCYKADYETQYKEPYRWNDLDGKRPTLEEYAKQKQAR